MGKGTMKLLFIFTVVVNVLMALVAATNPLEKKQPEDWDELKLQDEDFMEVGPSGFQHPPIRLNGFSKQWTSNRSQPIQAAGIGVRYEEDELFFKSEFEESMHRAKRQVVTDDGGSGSTDDGVEARVKVARAFSTNDASSVTTSLTTMLTAAYTVADVGQESFTVTVTDAGNGVMLATIKTFFTSVNQRISVAYAIRKYINGQLVADWDQSTEATIINGADAERTVSCFLCSCPSGETECTPSAYAVAGSTAANGLYPWGYSTNDDKLRHEELTSSETMTLPFDVVFVSTARSYLSIGNKGAMTLLSSADDNGYNSGSLSDINSVAANIVCAFCADIDTSLTPYNSGIFYHVYAVHDGTAESMAILGRATTEVRDAFGERSTFRAQQVVVVTWWNVPYAVSSTTSSAARSTFQAVIITDGQYSFVIFLYDDIGWPQAKIDIALAGFKHLTSSALQHYKVTQENNDQRTSESIEVITGTGSGNQGYFLLQLGSLSSPSSATVNKQDCGIWFQDNFPLRATFTANSEARDACQCAKNHMNSNSLFTNIGNLNGKICFDRSASQFNDGLRCCYGGGSLNKDWHSRYLRFNSGDQYTREDVTPVNKCCTSSGMCQLVRLVRPLKACNPASSVSSAAGVGDPHITTGDGLSITVNPVGEFWLIKMEATGVAPFKFWYQGRMSPAKKTDGSLSKATVFTAFAAKQIGTEAWHNGRFFIELNEQGTKFVVSVNGQDVSSNVNDVEGFKKKYEGKIQVERLTAKNVQFTFIGCDIAIIIKRSDEGILSHETVVPKKHSGNPTVTTQGLLGNYDGDKSNDLRTEAGEFLSTTTATEEEIFAMATSWRIAEGDSLFDYNGPLTFANVNDESFEPLFISSIDDKVLNDALETCITLENIQCVLDLAATGNKNLAAETNSEQQAVNEAVAAQANTAPTIDGKKIWWVKVGEEASAKYTATDPDNEAFTFVVSSKPEGLTHGETSGEVRWTPADTTPVEFVINALDARQMASEPINVDIVLCENCQNGAPCDYGLPRVSPVENAPATFRLATCVCPTGWGGSDCSVDIDACLSKPCGESRGCTDNNPSVQVSSGQAFVCGPCPAGYASPAGSYKCDDVNECNGAHGCPANSQCENTEGSFLCNCDSGYRKSGGECIDKNECSEGTNDCAQLCENTGGSFTCSCFAGYTTTDNARTCTEPTVTPPACSGHTCSQICLSVEGAATCKCRSGYLLGDDGQTCNNINECTLGLCPQDCTDSEGSYTCSCYDGFKLSSVGDACDKCVVPKWGPACANTCDCKGRASRCDSVKGCICDPNWSGPTCEVDVNECLAVPSKCGLIQTCENIDGGYKCNCPTGYDKDELNCIDQDECSAAEIPCGANSECVNTVGSYTCVCNAGYIKNGVACDDINECTNGVAKCEQVCVNTGGSFNCQCRTGYTLNDDRITCRQYADVCGGDQGCAHYCVIESEAPTCKCNKGYVLASDTRGCNDIDECAANDLNLCTDKTTCKNTAGGFECSCPVGQKLENDQRTCVICDDNFWGINCANECGCNPKGNDGCNKETGCICKTGWAGDKCESDLNECDTTTCIDNSDCVNLPGTFECKCRDGFLKSDDGTACNNIDECASALSNVCENDCQDTVGDYTCSCENGFVLEGKGKCVDVDECKLLTSGCEQNCVNTVGKFVCQCFEGFTFDPTDITKCIQVVTCTRTDCTQNCFVSGGTDTCFCNPGYELNADQKTCDNIDECAKDPPLCSGSCQDSQGSYTCTCAAGFYLADDQSTCIGCATNKWGVECATNCACIAENTQSCSTVTGQCTCRDGWTGNTCETDVLECATTGRCGENGVCTEKPGSFQCSCEPGYLRTDVCTQCGIFKYGTNCAQTCTCDTSKATGCNNVDGACTCKPEWTGADCTDDVNECTIAGRVTCGANEECNNLEGSYECACTRGYVKSPTTNACVPCNKGSFGDSCVEICDCEVGHFDSCNNLDGNCTCSSGWVGNRCETNVDECAQVPTVCPSELTTCSDTPGSYDCQCVTGYQKNGAECVPCSFGKYGDCNTDCPCTIANIASCNNINGSCTCKSGWSGGVCDTDVNECDATPAVCNTTISTCRNIGGSFVCDCLTGYKKSGEECVPCGFGKYGDCNTDCPCTIANIASCNNIDGSCTCKSGWSGSMCSDDVNECDATPAVCNNAISTCRNIGGSYACDCKTGYTSVSSNTCEDVNECSPAGILNTCTYNCINTAGSFYCNCPLGYTGSGNNCTAVFVAFPVVFVLQIDRRSIIILGSGNPSYQALLLIIDNIVNNILRQILGDAYVPANITSLQAGSVIANVDMRVDPTKTTNPNNLAAAGAKALANSGPVDIDGTSAPVSGVTLNGNEVKTDENPCDLLKKLQTLSSEEYCEVSDGGIPVVRKLDSTSTDVPLIIGLTVPFALILIIVVAILVYYCCCRSTYKTYGRRPPSDEGRENLAFRSAFVGNLPTKGNFGASRYMMYSPHTLSETASQASGEGYKFVRPKTIEGRSDFQDMPAQSERNYQQFSSPRDGWEDNGRSNFSWENMFNTEPSRNPPFEVPRPNVSNSPTRVYRGHGRYDSLA